MTSTLAVRTSGLSRRFGERLALDAVDLEVQPGEVFGLLGPNGGGKSTLFRVLSTLLEPTAGSAEVFGHDVVREPRAVRRSIGVVFQMPSLDAKLRVLENLEIHGRLFGLLGAEAKSRSRELLDRFGVGDRASDVVGTLSGGLARRVEIAKGMMSKPRLLLLDEPSTGLDPGARHELRDLIFRVRDEEGATIVWTTHLLDEADVCDRIAILDAGRRIAIGTPRELKAELPGALVLADVRDPHALEARAQADFGVAAEAVGGALRFALPEMHDAHALATRLTADLGDELLAVTIGRASLEDVFLARTGKTFDSAAESAEASRANAKGRRHG